MSTITRPALRYHGGKFRLAPWIIQHFPFHRVYTETFGGGASVLLRKPRAYAEVYNDMDGELCNLFKVARDHGDSLQRALTLTPFSRNEFLQSYESAADPLEQARRTVIRSFMGFGSGAASGKSTGFRSNSNRSGTTPAHDWANYPESLRAVIERLRGVVIENKDAAAVMKAHDSPETLHYVDPPYVMSTRSDAGADYRYEMTDADHEVLAETLHQLSGMVILSGYASTLYADLYDGWTCFSKAALADGATERTEVIWLNPACADALEQSHGGLFAGARA